MTPHPQPIQRTPWPFMPRPQPTPSNEEVRRVLGWQMTQKVKQ
jgi:hypothetical protein